MELNEIGRLITVQTIADQFDCVDEVMDLATTNIWR